MDISYQETYTMNKVTQMLKTTPGDLKFHLVGYPVI